MRNIPSRFETALRKHAMNLTSAVSTVSEATAGKDYSMAAFAGGNRSYFNSEDEIKRHYANVSSEGRERGTAAMNALLKDMNEAVDMGLRINPAKAVELQASMQLIRDDAALLRFVSDGERRHDYTTISAAAQYTGKDGKSTPAARAIMNRLNEYERALSETIRKTEKFLDKAFRGDKTCADGWSTWITGNIEESARAYDSLQAAIDGEHLQQNSLADVVSSYMERKGA